MGIPQKLALHRQGPAVETGRLDERSLRILHRGQIAESRSDVLMLLAEQILLHYEPFAQQPLGLIEHPTVLQQHS